MKKILFVLSIVILLLPGGSIAQQSSQPTFQVNTLNHGDLFDSSLTEIISSLDAYSGPAFNKDFAVQAVQYRLTSDGGYSDELASIEATYNYYQLLKVIGMTGVEETRIRKFITERVNPDGNLGFSRYPGSSWADDRESFLMAAMYLDLGYSLTTTVSNQLFSRAKEIIENNHDSWYMWAAAEYLSVANKLGSVNSAPLYSSLQSSQNTDTNSEYYGAISVNPTSTYNWDYSIENIYQVFKIAKAMNFDLSALFNLPALDQYLDSLRENIINKDGNVYWNYARLDYNETYASLPDINHYFSSFRYNDNTWRNTFAAYSIRTDINNYISANFSIAGAQNLVLARTYNSYWLDENSDQIIDRIPWNRYLPVYGNDAIDMFADVIAGLGIVSSLNLAALRQEVASQVLVEGGFSYNPSNAIATSAALSVLYHLDRKGLTYINAAPNFESSLTFMRNLNYSFAYQNELWVLNNGTQFYPIWFKETINQNYAERESIYNYYGYSIDSTTKVLDIFNKLGRLNDLQPLLQNISLSYEDRVEEGLIYSELISPRDGYNLIEGTEILGIQSQLDFSMVQSSLGYLQTVSGGFIHPPSWDDSLSYASVLLDFGSSFDFNTYNNLILADIFTTSYEQGMDYSYKSADSVYYWPTNELINYLSEAGILNTWIANSNLDRTKLARGAVSTYGSHYGYTNIIPYLNQLYETIRSLVQLGYDLNNLPTDLYLNITEVVRYVKDLQFTASTSSTEHPVGSFGDSISSIGIEGNSFPINAYYALYILNATGHLYDIDTITTLNYLKAQEITDINNYYYGLMRYYPGDTWGDLDTTTYGRLAMKLLGYESTLDISNFIGRHTNNVNGRMIYYQWELQQSLRAIKYLGLDTNLINMTIFENTLQYFVTTDGFLASQFASLENTYYAARSLKALNALNTINSDAMFNFMAELQILQEDYWNFGGFSHDVYYDWTSLASSEMVLYVLFRNDQLDRINASAAIDYVNKRFEDYGYSGNYFDAQLWGDILPAVRIFDSLADVMLPKLVTQKHVVETQTITMDVTITDIWQDPISGVTGQVFQDDASVGYLNDDGNGLYSFSLPTTGMVPGVYTFRVNFTKINLVDTSLEFDIEVLDNVINPEVFYPNPLMKGADLDLSIRVKDLLGDLVSPDSITVHFEQSDYTPIYDSIDGTYDVQLPTSGLLEGLYGFNISISKVGYPSYDWVGFNFEVKDISFQWSTTSSSSDTIDVNEDWSVTGFVVDNQNVRRDDVIFASTLEGPDGSDNNALSTQSNGNGEYTLTVSQSDPSEGDYTLTVEMALSSAPTETISVVFRFTREDNSQTVSGTGPEFSLPGFELYIALISLFAIPVLRRRYK